MSYQAVVVGSTGLVGGNVLAALQAAPSSAAVTAIIRRPLQTTHSFAKVQALVEPESSSWAAKLRDLRPVPDLFISSLGTTRASAGGIANQRKIDYDLNLELAKAAKEAGVKIYVLTSSAGANASSRIPYSKMRGELEEAVKQLDFEQVVILRPGLIVGEREESQPAEAVLRYVAKFAGCINQAWLKDPWAQDAEVIARASVHAGTLALEGKAPPGRAWIVDQKSIIALGRTEWPSFSAGHSPQ